MTVMRVGAEEQLRRAVTRIAHDTDPAHTAQRVLDALLAAVPGADAGALLLLHPQSGLFWTGAVTGLPAESCHPFFRAELSSSPDSFRRMGATGGSARALRLRDSNAALREVVEAHGYVDELRVVLPDAGIAWGGVSLWRRLGEFTAADEALLDSVAADAGAVLRRSVLTALDTGAAAPGACGMLVIEEGRLVELSLDDPVLRAELEDTRFEAYRHVDHLVALASADAQFSTVLRTSDGRWLSAHGMELGPGRAAVMLTAATPAELLGHRIAGAGLSPREVEVTRLLCRGLSDAEIAAELYLSPHTVHDHVRAVRGKLGVRSRAAVVSRVFDDTYFDAFIASAAIRHDG